MTKMITFQDYDHMVKILSKNLNTSEKLLQTIKQKIDGGYVIVERFAYKITYSNKSIQDVHVISLLNGWGEYINFTATIPYTANPSEILKLALAKHKTSLKFELSTIKGILETLNK